MCVYVQIRCSSCSLILWCDFGCTLTDENIRSCSDFEVLERLRPSKVSCERKTAVRFQCGQASFTAPWWPVPEVIKVFYLWINEAKKSIFLSIQVFFSPLLLLMCLYWTKMLSFSSHFHARSQCSYTSIPQLQDIVLVWGYLSGFIIGAWRNGKS